jgi:hypothetical protein
VQLVVSEAKPSAGHVPDVPVQLSATSHCPAEARHSKLDAWKASTHVLLVPVQWSAGSSSHDPPWESPVQLTVSAANPSAGHVPEVPVQLSATSH